MQRSGFSLVELSIVLVLIGLVTGAVIVGGELRFAFKVRAIVKDIDAIKSTARAFELKYQYMPGDFPHASRVWPEPGVYDGNGDRLVESISLTYGGGNWGWNHYENEMINFWEHLQLAGMYSRENYEGFTQIASSADIYAALVNYAIQGNLKNAYNVAGGIEQIVSKRIVGTSAVPDLNDMYAYYSGRAGFTSEEVFLIDAKYDDGFPNNGSFFTTNAPADSMCIIGDFDDWKTTATSYNLAISDIQCTLYIQE